MCVERTAHDKNHEEDEQIERGCGGAQPSHAPNGCRHRDRGVGGQAYQGGFDLSGDPDDDDQGRPIVDGNGAMPDVFHRQAAHSVRTRNQMYGGTINFHAGLTDAGLQQYLMAGQFWHRLCQPQSSNSHPLKRQASASYEVPLTNLAMANEFSDTSRNYILRGIDISLVRETYWDKLASAETPSQEELASIICNARVSRITTADSESVSGHLQIPTRHRPPGEAILEELVMVVNPLQQNHSRRDNESWAIVVYRVLGFFLRFVGDESHGLDSLAEPAVVGDHAGFEWSSLSSQHPFKGLDLPGVERHASVHLSETGLLRAHFELFARFPEAVRWRRRGGNLLLQSPNLLLCAAMICSTDG